MFLGHEFGLKILVRQPKERSALVGKGGHGIPVLGGAGVEHGHAGRAEDAFPDEVVRLGQSIVQKVGGAMRAGCFRPHALGGGVVRTVVVETDQLAVVSELGVGPKHLGPYAVHHGKVRGSRPPSASPGIEGRHRKGYRLVAIPTPAARAHPVAHARRDVGIARQLEHVQRHATRKVQGMPAQGDKATEVGIWRNLADGLAGQGEHAGRTPGGITSRPVVETLLLGRLG